MLVDYNFGMSLVADIKRYKAGFLQSSQRSVLCVLRWLKPGHLLDDHSSEELDLYVPGGHFHRVALFLLQIREHSEHLSVIHFQLAHVIELFVTFYTTSPVYTLFQKLSRAYL